MFKGRTLCPIDPSGIWVIDDTGHYEWLETPFAASCLDDLPGLAALARVSVEEVAKTPQNEMVYVIGKHAYYAYHFTIHSGLS